MIGLPYGPAVVDDNGYGVQCPACPEISRAPEGTVGEDKITKLAGRAYALHYGEKHS